MECKRLEVARILNDPVITVKGIGKKAGEQLESLKIISISDLLMTFPYRHDDFTLKDLSETPHNERVTIEGRVESEPAVLFLGNKRSRLEVRLLAGRHLVKAVFFNQHYLKDRIEPGSIVTVTGKWDRGRQSINVSNFTSGPKSEQANFEPVYSLKGVMHQKTFRRFMRSSLDSVAGLHEDPLPAEILEAYKLPTLEQALEMLHFPKSPAHMKHARRRFVYEELLLFQLKMQGMKKIRKESDKGVIIEYDLSKVKDLIASLPYELTGAQKRVVNELCAEMKSDVRMNRLLQGDVGSGKTVVAAIALYAAITAGFQGALMAPTEILAEQHAASLAEWLEPFDVTVAFLSGSTKAKARVNLLERLASGDVDLLIGTHALIQPDVIFKNLGLVITDEQHRFGVEQRRVLREKGINPGCSIHDSNTNSKNARDYRVRRNGRFCIG